MGRFVGGGGGGGGLAEILRFVPKPFSRIL